MNNIYIKVGKELGLDPKLVERVYNEYWRFVKETIIGLDLDDVMPKEEFDKIKTSFNLPSLGKLGIRYTRYCKINNTKKKKYASEYKENQTDV